MGYSSLSEPSTVVLVVVEVPLFVVASLLHAHNDNAIIPANTPQITFVLDQSIAYGVAMSKKIDDVMKNEDVE